MADSESLGPRLNIISWLLVSFAAVFLSLRIYCKVRTRRKLWWDDQVLIASWVFLLIYTAIVSANISLGFGRHISEIDPAHLVIIGLNSNVSETFSILAAALGKTSFAVTLLRVTDGHTRMFLAVSIVFIDIAMGLSAVFAWVRCNPYAKTWQPLMPGTCWDPDSVTAYNIFAGALSAAMDITLSFLPWKIIWHLQMRKKEKFGIGLAMNMGVFAAITNIVKCTKISTLASGDFTYHGYDLVIWGTAESATTIMAASIPVLRVLFRDIRLHPDRHYDTEEGTGPRERKRVATPLGVGLESDASDRSILRWPVAQLEETGQTSGFTLKLHERPAGTGIVTEKTIRL